LSNNIKKSNTFQLNQTKTLSTVLVLFGLTAHFSISLSQIFFGVLLFIWLIDIFSKLFLNKSISMEKKVAEYFKDYHVIKDISLVVLVYVIQKIVYVIFSENPSKEFNASGDMWLIFFFFFIFYKLYDKKHVNYLIIGLLIGGALTGLYNIKLLDPKIFYVIYRRAGGFNSMHPLTYAGITALTIILSLYMVISSIIKKKLYIKALFIFLLIFTVFGFFLSKSAGVYISFFFIILFNLTILLKKKMILILSLIILLPVMLFSYSKRVRYVFERTTFDYSGKTQSSLDQRLIFWRTGIKMWLERPLLGTSETNYMKIYQLNKYPEAKGVASTGSHMHNDLLDTLVRFGSIGFTLQLMFYLFPVITFFRRMDYFLESEEKWMILSSLSAIVMMFLMGLTQCHFRDDEVQILFWAAMGIFYRSIHNVENDNEKRNISKTNNRKIKDNKKLKANYTL